MRMITILRLHISALLVIAAVSAAGAQSPPPTDIYSFKVYNAGVSAPLSTTTLVNTDILCNQTPSPVGAKTTNPNIIEWTDENNSGKVCRWTQGAGNLLVALPIGSYEGTVTLTNDAGASPESSKVPFSRAPLPAARTGVRIVR